MNYIKISALGYGKTFHELKRLRKVYEDTNKKLEKTYNEILKEALPPRYYMNLGCIEVIDFLLNN